MPDDDDEAVLLCYRVVDFPDPVAGSLIERCFRCGWEVWRGPFTPSFARPLCWRCAPSVLGPDDPVQMSAEQREAFRAVGLTDVEIDGVLAAAELNLDRIKKDRR